MTNNDRFIMSPSSSSAPVSSTLAGGGGSSLEDTLSQLLSSNSQFSVPAYLNLALLPDANRTVSSSSEDSLQSRMTELALQLQFQTQACHDEIGRIGAELQAILPRCAADVSRVGVGLDGMRVDAQILLEHTKMDEEEQELSSSLASLSTLHALQSNLTAAKKVLTAAATWDSTMASIPPLLAQQKLSEAVNALAQLEHGERALRGMPHRDEREQAIAKVRQQVQTLLHPQLLHALQNMSTRLAPLQQCVSLFEKLNKMDSLREQYVKIRPGALHKAWFAFAPSYTADGDRNPSGTDFSDWLPTWYDMVLQLLAEERRQSTTVFGAESAPDILVQVMKECFRPILPSFSSRLESTFSSNPAVNSKGSFESICVAYEATLRFISLAYELVAGAFLDLAEAGLKRGDSGVGLYQQMVDVMATVASPFQNYQRYFDQLEQKHLQGATSMVAKDMQQAVVSVTPSLETLQDAIERLKDLAPYIFPLTEGSLARFELLVGGYTVAPTLGTVDQIFAHHIGEVVICIRSLSAAVTSDANHLADNFDEQHVLCALEVLKLAGNACCDLRTFESKTRDKLSLMSDRIVDHIQRETDLGKATSKSGMTSSSFTLPDSLSMVEINSFLTKSVCGDAGSAITQETVDANVTHLAQNPVAAFLDAGLGGVGLYPEAQDAIQRLARSCHTFVFEVCSAVPRKHLATMSENSAWRQHASVHALDSYGIVPQAYITHVGEHMLALVQAIEPYAADQETLAISNEIMTGVKDVALQPWGEFASSAGINGSDSTISLLMNAKVIGTLVLNNSALSEEDAHLGDGISAEERASAEFCNAWLDVVGLAVTGRLLERIMRIPQLTAKGCEHLNADLNYFVNVFSALGVAGHPHPLVSHLASLAALGDDDLQDHVMGRSQNATAEAALRSIEVRFAQMRGVSVN